MPRHGLSLTPTNVLSVMMVSIKRFSAYVTCSTAWKMNFSPQFLVRGSQEQFSWCKSVGDLPFTAKDGGKTNQIVFCTRTFIVLFINAIVRWRPT